MKMDYELSNVDNLHVIKWKATFGLELLDICYAYAFVI
jgi:hypothetical protein